MPDPNSTAATTAVAQPLGHIDTNAIYPTAELKALGLGPWAIRKARAKGLRVAKVGRRCFVSGAELSRFINQQAQQQSAPSEVVDA